MENVLNLKEKIILNILILIVKMLTKENDCYSSKYYCELKTILDLVNGN